jgi:senataxin
LTLPSKLELLDKEVHLFCPKQNDDDPVDYNAFGQDDITPDDIPDPEFSRLLKAAEERRDMAIRCLECFAYSGTEGAFYQNALRPRINHLLKTCNICIIQYYRGKKALLERLLK